MKALCFIRHYDTAPVWSCRSRRAAKETQTYVFEHLMPVKVEDSKNKRWYWMKYIAEEIDFWTCNDAYKELYDRQAFQETIKKCQCSFGTGISYRFKVRLTYAVVKHK